MKHLRRARFDIKHLDINYLGKNLGDIAKAQLFQLSPKGGPTKSQRLSQRSDVAVAAEVCFTDDLLLCLG
jgi:hypothetical protein